MTERYLVPSEGSDEIQVAFALLAITELAKKHECAITLLVPALKYIEGTVLSNVLKDKFIRNLRQGKRGKLDGIAITMSSKKTFNPHMEAGVILSLWGGKESLILCDQAKEAKAIVALPWIPEDVEAWIHNWNPVIIDTSIQAS